METNVKAVELRELWRRYKVDGDEKARERLVVAYSPLVKYVAGRMAAGLPSHVEESDLISYGLLGLIGAIERYEPDRKSTRLNSSHGYISYAVFCLKKKKVAEAIAGL